MAFNLGSFAGGLASGASNTYMSLNQIENMKQERAFKEEERAKQNALDTAYAETYGAGDTKTNVSYGIPGADGTKPTEYTDVDGPGVAPTTTQTAYTAKQKAEDFQRKAAALGARGTDVQKTMAGGYQLENERRTNETNQKKFELIQARNESEATLKGFVDAKDPAGLVGHFGPMLAAQTGHSYAMVSGPKGQTVEIRDGKGKLVESHKADAEYIAGKLGPAMEDHYLSQFSALDPEFGLKVRKDKRESRELDIKEPYYKAEANKANAQASALGAADSDRRKTSSPVYQKMLEQGNEITDKLNTTTDPKERALLQREADMHQVKIANFLGKTLVPKDRGVSNELSPVKDNPGMFVANSGIYYRQDGDSFTPILTPALAAKVKSEADAVKAENAVASKRTQALAPRASGSHTPVDTWKPAGMAPGLPSGARAELADIDARLKLVGISPETEADLLLRRQSLLGGNTGNRLLNARGID